MSVKSLIVAAVGVAAIACGCGDDDGDDRPDAGQDGLTDATRDATDVADALADAADATVACVRAGPRNVRGLAAGQGYSVAVLENGDALLWGAVLGRPRPPFIPPRSVDTGCRKTVEVAGGRFHACVRLDDGDVRCWGRNDTGQLGIAGDTMQLEPATPVNLGTGRTAVALAAGHQHTCAGLDNGHLRCFGGEILDGQNGNLLIPLGEGRTVTAIGAGDAHTCAVLDNGELRCWGKNDDGQLGLGDTTPRMRPDQVVDVGVGRTAVQIAAGRHFTCARLDNGEVKCWGLNTDGQLGLGDTSPRLSPTTAVALGQGRTAVEIAAGFDFACARLDDDTVKCWGTNGSGQLGVGDAEGHASPTKAVNLGTGRKAVEIAAGMSHACARLDSGIVKCWGDNDQRALGIPDPLNHGDSPDELGDNLPAVPLGD
jgi:alpha-tubulin suppressor-like RCC1 family protein